ncbi:hypothetical protein ONZ45_g1664 [Pleurotus djamor]|nr:hypothetical protein ONZ45_g1664 [Pleurotus djamor]
MSLSSFLLSSKAVDSDLDALFGSNANVAPPVAPLEKPKSRSKKRVQAESAESEATTPAKKAKRTHKNEGPEKSKSKKQKHLETAPPPVASDSSDNSDEESDSVSLIHETLRKTKKSKTKTTRKAYYVPSDESSSQRDLRTVFVGNLPVSVAQRKRERRELQRTILSFVPGAKIESIRFRSIAFRTPTSKLPNNEEDPSQSKTQTKPVRPRAPTDDAAPSNSRKHSQDRASAWKGKHDDEDLKVDEKKFLTPDQKKKISFINQEFHSSADTMNAYIVFAHPTPSDDPSITSSGLDPYEIARVVAEKADGVSFMEHVLRVDVTGQTNKTEGDPKLSVFVGNLDFATKEEDLRAYFEGVVASERGPPPESTSGKPNTWVTRVRLIRDKETQLGKGFGYVQFLERECVDELLALEEGKLKFAKRKLRVQRCKVIPGTNAKSPSKAGVEKVAGPSKPVAIPSIPKGDPRFGEKLVNLSKDERKKVKASDADRVARRLAKKKARNALSHTVDPTEKHRTRVRKPQAPKTGKPTKEQPRKGRIRSEKAFAKRNMKK